MNLSIYQHELSALLGKVGRAVSSRSTMPVLGNILLTATDGELSAAATNFEIGIIATGPADVTEDGAITLPAKQLADFVNALPNDERIDISLNERTQTAAFKCAGYSARMKGIAAEDFPIIPTGIPDAAPITLDAGKLAIMLGVVTKAASTDESRPTLSGVEFSADGGSLHLAATDGYRLATWRTQDAFDGSFIVPAKALAELARILPDDGECSVAFDPDGARMLATVPGVTMNCQLIDARFPDYRAIVPDNSTVTVITDAAELRKATQMAWMFSREAASGVRYTIAEDGITVASVGNESGDSESFVDAQVDGEGLGIVMNGKYVMDALGGIGGKVVLSFTQWARPMMMTAEAHDGLVWVIMPMHQGK